jgi:preprotein translocase subunit SecE
VAEGKSTPKKPRIRKAAPTIREQAVAAQADASREKPRRVRKAGSKVAGFLSKTRITRNPLVALLAKVGRGILKVLRWLIPSYFVNAWREVRLVTWPTRRETWRLTLAVFIFAIIFGAMVSGVDKVLDLIFKKVVLK